VRSCVQQILVNKFVSHLARAVPASLATVSGRMCSTRSFSAVSPLSHIPIHQSRVGYPHISAGRLDYQPASAFLYYSSHTKQDTAQLPDIGDNGIAKTHNLSAEILIQAAMEYQGPLDAPPIFLSKYRHPHADYEAGVFLLDAEPSDQKIVLDHLRVDPLKPVPYDNSKVGNPSAIRLFLAR